MSDHDYARRCLAGSARFTSRAQEQMELGNTGTAAHLMRHARVLYEEAEAAAHGLGEDWIDVLKQGAPKPGA